MNHIKTDLDGLMQAMLEETKSRLHKKGAFIIGKIEDDTVSSGGFGTTQDIARIIVCTLQQNSQVLPIILNYFSSEEVIKGLLKEVLTHDPAMVAEVAKEMGGMVIPINTNTDTETLAEETKRAIEKIKNKTNNGKSRQEED